MRTALARDSTSGVCCVDSAAAGPSSAASKDVDSDGDKGVSDGEDNDDNDQHKDDDDDDEVIERVQAVPPLPPPPVSSALSRRAKLRFEVMLPRNGASAAVAGSSLYAVGVAAAAAILCKLLIDSDGFVGLDDIDNDMGGGSELNEVDVTGECCGGISSRPAAAALASAAENPAVPTESSNCGGLAGAGSEVSKPLSGENACKLR